MPDARLVGADVRDGVGLFGLMFVSHLAPRPKFGIDHPVTFARVQEIVRVRCVPCHSKKPRDDTFRSAPVGI